jgi:DNA-directed RNA polymerase specialized sigma54-like protein
MVHRRIRRFFSPKATRNERIHEALRLHGYTLQGVGDAVGLHYSTVSRIAKGLGTHPKRAA